MSMFTQPPVIWTYKKQQVNVKKTKYSVKTKFKKDTCHTLFFIIYKTFTL